MPVPALLADPPLLDPVPAVGTITTCVSSTPPELQAKPAATILDTRRKDESGVSFSIGEPL
jgi:hypothetical protein